MSTIHVDVVSAEESIFSGQAKFVALPGEAAYAEVTAGSGNQPVSTTTAFTRLLRNLCRDEQGGARIVPIIPDEARTFGMDSLFPTQKIYSPKGQNYVSVDRELMLAYKENTAGQILHEGINEAGSTASFIGNHSPVRQFHSNPIKGNSICDGSFRRPKIYGRIYEIGRSSNVDRNKANMATLQLEPKLYGRFSS